MNDFSQSPHLIRPHTVMKWCNAMMQWCVMQRTPPHFHFNPSSSTFNPSPSAFNPPPFPFNPPPLHRNITPSPWAGNHSWNMESIETTPWLERPDLQNLLIKSCWKLYPCKVTPLLRRYYQDFTQNCTSFSVRSGICSEHSGSKQDINGGADNSSSADNIWAEWTAIASDPAAIWGGGWLVNQHISTIHGTKGVTERQKIIVCGSRKSPRQ